MIFLSVILAVFCSALAVPLARSASVKFGVIDKPGGRKIHRSFIPRLGGVAIFIGVMVGCALFALFTSRNSFVSDHFSLGAFLLGMPLALLVGLWDDVCGIGSKRKLAAQFLLGGFVYFAGFRIETLSFGAAYTFDLGVLAFPFTILWIATVMNAINLIDGMDGLASGVSIIAFLLISILSWAVGNSTVATLALIAAGASVGFLWFNFAPAKIFMGDSGSMLLGFILAVLTMSISPKGAGHVPFYVTVFVLALPVLDMGVAILRRMINTMDELKGNGHVKGFQIVLNIFRRVVSADGDHIHHRLLEKGWSYQRVVMVLYGFSLLTSVVSVILFAIPHPFQWPILGVSLFVIVQLVQNLEYPEFMPRSVRRLSQKEGTVGELPAVLKRVGQ